MLASSAIKISPVQHDEKQQLTFPGPRHIEFLKVSGYGNRSDSREFLHLLLNPDLSSSDFLQKPGNIGAKINKAFLDF